MPGLFSSWKPRFRVRKTSDSERSSSSIPPFFPSSSSSSASSNKHSNKRAVHFNDIGVGSTRNGPVNTAGWKYADEDKAPLANGEPDEPKDELQTNGNNNLGSSLPPPQQPPAPPPPQQQQQEQVNGDLNGAASDNETQSVVGTLPRLNRLPGSLGVVYLELNDEVKRALLPPAVSSIDTVRALFLRSFPQLTSQYLSLPHVKIYIQEPSKGQLFYELDDLRDIKDQAVLKLREQLGGYQSPQPIRFADHPPLDYLSESEIDMMDYRSRIPHRYRPSSALDSRMLTTTGTIKSARSPIPLRFDSYYDPYASDTSSQERSGSITPIIDKEARFRMETMERQLAGLSSLVHSALVSKGISETSQRDMQELRKQILALHPDVASVASESSVPSSAEPSLPDSVFLSGETQQQLLKLKRHAAETQNQLKQIRRAAQMNNQTARDILRDAFDRVQRYVAEHMGVTGPHLPLNYTAEALKSEHIAQITNLQKSLQTFEEDVEEVRRLVLNTNRKLRMNEVESFTQTLTKIGRNAAKLKTQFPTVQRELEKEIKANMERIVCEEKFIKEEATQIDQCLRRCKTLANMMVTMKKLAMVQDPSLNASKLERNSRSLFTLKENGFMPRSSRVVRNDFVNGKIGQVQGRAEEEEPPPPPVPPTPANYEGTSNSSKSSTDANVLDTILDELTNTVQRDRRSKSKSPSSTRSDSVVRSAPPKPPQRYSTVDVRSRFTPSEVQEIQRRAIECVSPGPGNRFLASDMEERQEKLAEKQRQLHSQFEQLQQMCSPSSLL